mmetsp:Transcript_12465/g.29422  ORF Transcript_12465/g.29422 Transcript_12465/m.29422 type:complete len:214 (-) Transcript_12465:1274-1915(-)
MRDGTETPFTFGRRTPARCPNTEPRLPSDSRSPLTPPQRALYIASYRTVVRELLSLPPRLLRLALLGSLARLRPRGSPRHLVLLRVLRRAEGEPEQLLLLLARGRPRRAERGHGPARRRPGRPGRVDGGRARRSAVLQHRRRGQDRHGRRRHGLPVGRRRPLGRAGGVVSVPLLLTGPVRVQPRVVPEARRQVARRGRVGVRLDKGLRLEELE